jgi:serine protease AprX
MPPLGYPIRRTEMEVKRLRETPTTKLNPNSRGTTKTVMTLNSRTFARWLCALATVLVVTAGLAPAADAAKGGPVDAAAKLEPTLLQGVQAHPDAKFNVIVTRGPVADVAKRRQHKAQVEDAIRAENGRIGGALDIIGGHTATLTGKGVLKLAANPHVKSVALDHPVKLMAATTTQISQIQSLQTVTANAPQVWTQYGNQGQGVTVAIIDSGIIASPDIPTAVFGVDTATGTTTLSDLGGHGSHVAGIVAGNGLQSLGAYEGVAPSARVVEVKVTGNQGTASYGSIIKGIQWVVANAKAYNIRVANMSIGAVPTTGYANDPLDAAVEVAWFRGITMVVSAGNSGPGAGTIMVPGNDPRVITVGAYDDNLTAGYGDDALPDWTSRGPTTFDNLPKPDIAASGRRVVSLRSVGSFLDLTMPDRLMGTKYFRLSGTSMSSPVVAGVAALLVAQNRNLTPNQIKYLLTSTARPLPFGVNAVGAGAVDALAAIRYASSPQGKANLAKTASRKTATTLWPVVKQMSPVWRHKGLWQGRMWVDGSWDASGFKLADGSWDDGSWDDGAWDNFAWEDGSWDDGSWDNASWDALQWNDGSWDSGAWDSSAWDSAETLSSATLN